MLPLRALVLAASLALTACVPAVRPAGPDGPARVALKIATWNVEHLAERNGEGCRPRTDADYAELRRHAEALGADVIALQEVENQAAAQRVFDPDVYDVVMSNRPSSGRGGGCRGLPGQTIRDQRVGFAIRKSVRWSRNPDVVDLGLGNPDLRWGVDVTVNGPRPLRLLGIHLKSGCNSGRAPTDADCPVLFAQLPVVARWVDARADAGEDFAILGDWNRRMTARGDQFFGALDRPERAATDLTIAGEGRGATCKARYAEFIDLIVTGPGATARVVPGSLREYRYDAPDERHPSDHCPVIVSIARR